MISREKTQRTGLDLHPCFHDLVLSLPVTRSGSIIRLDDTLGPVREKGRKPRWKGVVMFFPEPNQRFLWRVGQYVKGLFPYVYVTYDVSNIRPLIGITDPTSSFCRTSSILYLSWTIFRSTQKVSNKRLRISTSRPCEYYCHMTVPFLYLNLNPDLSLWPRRW